MARVLSVTAVHLSLQKSNPPTILVVADGTVGTPSWKNIDLVPMEKTLSADGILDLEFIGTPPTGLVPQVVRPATGDFVIDKDVDKIVGVTVHARTNQLTQLLAAALTAVPTEPTLAVGVTPPIGGIPQLDGRMTAFGGQFKTQVLGEEKWPGSEKFAFPQAEKLAIRPAETWPFRPAESFWAGETHPAIDDPKMPFEDFPFGSFVGENGPDPIDPLGPIMRANPFGFRGSR